ncbi:hypothetical protein [Streptomyces venetus]|uniref:hypothetical protein n=1 Tax=Streptomyces venetus TaxID=1701086 RepID=UPI0031ED6C59
MSLAFTAWGTWKAAQVADDQLAQSKEQQVADDRKQAALINFWVEKDTTVIANRSLDPAAVWAAARSKTSPSDSPGFMYWVGMLPPCNRIEIPNEVLDDFFQSPLTDEPFRGPYSIARLDVADAKGRGWTRSVSGQLSASSAAMPAPSKVGDSALLSDPAVRVVDLETCGTPT